MERSTQLEQVVTQLPQEQNLYGVRLFLSGENPESVRSYIDQQEKTHIAEGLELQQRTVRTLEYDGKNVLGFGGQAMVDVNRSGYRDAKKQYLAGDKAAYGLMKRREHDVTISEFTDSLMSDGQIGDAILVTSPYQEELDDSEARRLGFWPEFRRSYVWLYRKRSSTELECTDISIDQSSVDAYRKLLGEAGVEVPSEVESHDFPSYFVHLNIATDQERAEVVNNIIDRYSEINDDKTAKNSTNAFEAIDFLNQHAKHYLALIVDVHESIAHSIRTGNLHDLVKMSASRALKTLNCLDADEVLSLQILLSSNEVNPSHNKAFATLTAAQRYGVWEGINQLAVGDLADVKPPTVYVPGSEIHQALLLDEIYKNTNVAAEQHKVEPGCAGGTSFLQQNQESVKSSIFDGEKYVFNKEMYCVVCQAPPKEKAKKKWCGPCGICKTCDLQLKIKATKSA